MLLTLASIEGATLFLVAWIRLGKNGGPHGAFDPVTILHAFLITLCGLFALHFSDLYDMRKIRRFREFLARWPRALAMMFGLAAIVSIVPDFRASWRFLAETVLLAGLVILPVRAVLHHLFSVHPFSRRVLVIGTTELAGKVVSEMLATPDLRDVVVGVVEDGAREFKPDLPTLRLGSVENLGRIIEGFEPDLIVCAPCEKQEPFVVRELLKAHSRGTPIEDGVAAYERLTGKIAIEYAEPRAILFANGSDASWLTLFIARVMSFGVALVGITLTLPFLLPLVLLIKMDSEGPVFFLHERVGLGGRPFRLIKFRTMRIGGALSEWAADNHHRTTRVGHWLRRFRIDELPQFVNILRGDMNLVGPRPHPVSNVALFTENIPYYGLRCSVRPGVTGWAQIRYGYANNLAEETEKMRFDLHYIRHLSLAMDLRVLFETVKVVITGSKPATLADEPGAPLLPIYFGDEHPRRRRSGLHLEPSPLALAPLPVPAWAGQAGSIDEHRAEGQSSSSRDVA